MLSIIELTVKVSDGKDAAGSADTSTDDMIGVTITVANVNEPPEFDSSDVEQKVSENTATNTNIGDPMPRPRVDAVYHSAAIRWQLRGEVEDY